MMQLYFLKDKIFIKKNIFLYFIIYSTIALLFILIDSVFYTLNYIYLLNLFLMSFLIFFFIIFFKYKISIQDFERKINKEIPFFLNNLANDIDKNIPLKKALENRINDSLLGGKIKLIMHKVNVLGYSLSESLVSINIENKELKRVFYQIEDILSTGSINKADSLKTLSRNIVEKQNYKIKNYSTKLNLLSLIYIVISAIVPALFLMFILVGSNFLEISFSPLTIIFVIVILFPIATMFIFLIMKSSLP